MEESMKILDDVVSVAIEDESGPAIREFVDKNYDTESFCVLLPDD